VYIWDPVWLTVFFIHNVTYIYCAIMSRVKCVVMRNYLCPLFFCFWSSPLEWGGVGGFFCPLVLLYVSALCLWGGCASVFCNCEIGYFYILL